MKQVFQIEIEEILQKVVKIKANSLDEAFDIAQDRYDKEKYVLDYKDFMGVEFREYKDEVETLETKVKNYYQDQKNLELQWKEIKKLKPNNMNERDFLNLIQDIRMKEQDRKEVIEDVNNGR